METTKMVWADTDKVIKIEGTGGYLVSRVHDVWVTTVHISKAITVGDLLSNPQLLKDFVNSGLTYDTVSKSNIISSHVTTLLSSTERGPNDAFKMSIVV